MTVTAARRVRGIPTTYRGTRFRSRLEARWAAFFDLVDWRWVYEPFDAVGWIPDFLIAGPVPLLIEVGPVSTQAEFEDKAAKPFRHLEHATLVLGISPIVLADDEAGLLVNEFPSIVGPAWWTYCINDCAAAVHISGYGPNWPCQHPRGRLPHDGRRVFDLWADAGNRVQWKGR